MKNLLSCFTIFFIFSLISCKQASVYEKHEAVSAEAPLKAEEKLKEFVPGSENEKPAPPEEKAEIAPLAQGAEKKIIRDGSIRIRAQNLAESKKHIDQVLRQLNGYYETENFRNTDYEMAYDLTIRVPAAQFDKLIAGLENSEDEISDKNISARDVTEEFTDTETRLRNKRAYMERYRQLLTRAATVKDIIAIEENIRLLQEEIESAEDSLFKVEITMIRLSKIKLLVE